MLDNLKSVQGPLLIFGLILCIGIVTLAYSRTKLARSEHLQTVPLVSTGTLAYTQPEREVFVTGTVSPRNTATHADLIAFIHEKGTERREPVPTSRYNNRTEDSSDERSQTEYRVVGIDWETEATVSPPLLLDTDSGTIQIEAPGGGNGYSLFAPVRIENRQALQRFRGVKSREQVTALGVVDTQREHAYVDASVVFAGTHEQYIGQLNRESEQNWSIGLALSGIGLVVLLSICVWAVLKTLFSAPS